MKTLEFTCKTYSTEARALATASALVDHLADTDLITVIIAATGGRFAPVFHLRRDALYLAAAIASNGFHVIG